MPLMQFVNGNVTTTSSNGRTSSDTTLTPASTTGFPNQPQFTILERQTGEIILVTAVNAGPTWTVTRGFGGTTAAAITSGDNFDYSITREMLLAGMTTKLDEQSFSVDTANGVLTLTVPSGLAFVRNLMIRAQTNCTADNLLLWRYNSDSSATYDTSYITYGSSSSNTNASNLTFARAWAGNAGALPQMGTDVTIHIGSADSTDRIKMWNGTQYLRDNAGQFGIAFGGRWNPSVQAAISTIQLSCDSAGNLTWAAGTFRAGTRATLYGVP